MLSDKEEKRCADIWSSTLKEAFVQAIGSLGSYIEERDIRKETVENKGNKTDASARGDTRWPQRQWQIAFEIIFYQAPKKVIDIIVHDDLLFIVELGDDATCSDCHANAKDPPFFPIRRGSMLPSNLALGGSEVDLIDWRATFILNVVVHTQYRFTECICSRENVDLCVSTALSEKGLSTHPNIPGRQAMAESEDQGSTSLTKPGPRTCKPDPFIVQRTVHPSPTQILFSKLGSRIWKEDVSSPSYPDIFFAIDDIGETEAWKISSKDLECYCVILQADMSSSWSKALYISEILAKSSGQNALAENLTVEKDQPARHEQFSKINMEPVFSGYVTVEQLSKQPSASKFSRAFKGDNLSFLLMKGPEGIGRGEVAVQPGHRIDSSRKERTSTDMKITVNSMIKKTIQSLKYMSLFEENPSNPGPVRFALVSLCVPVDTLATNIMGAVLDAL